MQEFSSGRYPGFVETNDALITGVRSVARRLSFFVGNGISNLLGRVSKTFFYSHNASLVSRHEVAIMYFGHTSESLMMTSERMVIPTGFYTLGQLLCSLYKRGDRWVEELDDSDLMCTVNGRHAKLFDTIAPGAEICISSRRSIFEV
jgi:molybdopterin converting factor small subunit